MGNQMSLEENDESEHNEMKVIENEQNEIKVMDETTESNQGSQSGNGGNVNKKIKRNMQDPKGGLVKKRRSTSKSGANSNTFKKTRHNRRR